MIRKRKRTLERETPRLEQYFDVTAIGEVGDSTNIEIAPKLDNDGRLFGVTNKRTTDTLADSYAFEIDRSTGKPVDDDFHQFLISSSRTAGVHQLGYRSDGASGRLIYSAGMNENYRMLFCLISGAKAASSTVTGPYVGGNDPLSDGSQVNRIGRAVGRSESDVPMFTTWQMYKTDDAPNNLGSQYALSSAAPGNHEQYIDEDGLGNNAAAAVNACYQKPVNERRAWTVGGRATIKPSTLDPTEPVRVYYYSRASGLASITRTEMTSGLDTGDSQHDAQTYTDSDGRLWMGCAYNDGSGLGPHLKIYRESTIGDVTSMVFVTTMIFPHRQSAMTTPAFAQGVEFMAYGGDPDKLFVLWWAGDSSNTVAGAGLSGWPSEQVVGKVPNSTTQMYTHDVVRFTAPDGNDKFRIEGEMFTATGSGDEKGYAYYAVGETLGSFDQRFTTYHIDLGTYDELMAVITSARGV